MFCPIIILMALQWSAVAMVSSTIFFRDFRSRLILVLSRFKLNDKKTTIQINKYNMYINSKVDDNYSQAKVG